MSRVSSSRECALCRRRSTDEGIRIASRYWQPSGGRCRCRPLQSFGESVVRQDRIRRLGVDDVLQAVANRLRRVDVAAIGGANGGDVHSSKSVRHRLKKIIDAKAPDAILSDDALAEALQKDGIDIARRTVAKYREAMRIPSSVERRRHKAHSP